MDFKVDIETIIGIAIATCIVVFFRGMYRREITVTPTQQKEAAYARMAEDLGKYAEQDAEWCDADDPRWQKARVLDNKLVAARTDPTIDTRAFRVLTTQMSVLYVRGE